MKVDLRVMKADLTDAIEISVRLNCVNAKGVSDCIMCRATIYGMGDSVATYETSGRLEL